jgi:hypothetical protein
MNLLYGVSVERLGYAVRIWQLLPDQVEAFTSIRA